MIWDIGTLLQHALLPRQKLPRVAKTSREVEGRACGLGKELQTRSMFIGCLFR